MKLIRRPTIKKATKWWHNILCCSKTEFDAEKYYYEVMHEKKDIIMKRMSLPQTNTGCFFIVFRSV
jgi:hypothetical protein